MPFTTNYNHRQSNLRCYFSRKRNLTKGVEARKRSPFASAHLVSTVWYSRAHVHKPIIRANKIHTPNSNVSKHTHTHKRSQSTIASALLPKYWANGFLLNIKHNQKAFNLRNFNSICIHYSFIHFVRPSVGPSVHPVLFTTMATLSALISMLENLLFLWFIFKKKKVCLIFIFSFIFSLHIFYSASIVGEITRRKSSIISW